MPLSKFVSLYRFTFCFLFLNVWISSSFAQLADPKFTSITSMDGLSSNTVTAILKDHYGLLWFATDDGLNKFDGTDVVVYRHNNKDSSSLRSNDISSLHEDIKGNIWVGTIIGGLHLYDRKKDSFVNLTANYSVTSICSDSSGKLWVGTTGGLLFVNPGSLKVSKFSAQPGIPLPITTGLILSIKIDHKKKIWIGSDKGLFSYDQSKKQFEYIDYLKPFVEEPGARSVKTIFEDHAGNIWIGTFNGLFKLNSQGELLKRFKYLPTNTNSISSNIVFALAEENKNRLWVCTDAGLNIIDTKNEKITRYFPDPRTPFSLTNKSVRNILIDDQGIFWLGTYKGGINKYDKNLVIFDLKRSNITDPYGLSAPFVTSFAENADGNLFVGTDGGGLNLYNRKTNLFSKYSIIPKNRTASSGLAVLTLEAVSNTELWIGTFQDGLFKFNPKTGSYLQFTRGDDSSSLSNNDIFCLKKDRTGKLWIGSNGGGLNTYDPATNRFQRFFDVDIPVSKRKIPLNGYIRDIIEDRHGLIWIASHGSGIAVYNPLTEKSLLLNKMTSNLLNGNVLSLLEDSKGNIWAGTAGEGLALFDAKSQKFISFGEKEGLPSNVVNKILEDAQGRIWVSTNQGISSFDVQKKKFTNYTSYNGLQNKTFVLGSGIKASDDKLFFGGIAGFNELGTRSLPVNKQIPRIILKDLRIGNKNITPSDSNYIDADISVAKSINLDYKQNFSVGFAAIDYSNPKQFRYRHRLSGMEREWNETGWNNLASYTNLSPGKYVFEVQASRDGINWSPQSKSVKVIVKPPFYLTIYAYLFYLLFPLILVYTMRRRGIRKMKAQFREQQERTEAERVIELDRQKIKFVTNLSHEFRTPISLILAPVENLLIKTQSTEIYPQALSIKRNARRLLNLVDQLLDFKNMQEQELKLDVQRRDVVAHIRETCELFNDLSQRKGIKFKFDTRITHLDMDFDVDKLERILFNLLSNAFKFTPKEGLVTLEIRELIDQDSHRWLNIAVSDTGIGIPSDLHQKIFERFFKNDTNTAVLNQGSGIGLSIVKEFVELHQGKIKIESQPGKGSMITVFLPIHEADSPVISKPTNQAAQIHIENTDVKSVSSTVQREKQNSETISNILIIEDNEEFRHYLKENLMPFYNVVEASNGKEGWQKTLSHHPELIVSDIAMPEMDGITLSQKIKSDKRTSHIPIILLTASTGEEQQLEGLNSGANDYLTKPFTFAILNAKINNLILMNRLLKGAYSRHIKITGQPLQMESSQEKLLKEMLSYIDANLQTSQVTVENLSKHVGMSRGTLYSKVLEMSGQTPIEFIRSIKLEKAAMLLENSDLSVSQISYMTGFTAPNYFAKSFKAQFNMLPTEYKAIKRKPSPPVRSVGEK